jgi:hypothetical protein
MAISDQAIGFILLGVGLVVVLGLVFAVSSRVGSAGRPRPPRGVHLPAPSYLPVVLSVAGFLLGAGLAFRAEGELANPFLAIPGVLVLIAGAVSWVRSAGHEWRDAEVGPHDDVATH